MNNLLKIAFRLNALSCLGFGTVFILNPDTVGAFLDGFPPDILRWIGIGLGLNGLHLVFASFRKRIGRVEVIYFVLGDVAWVLGSLVLVIFVPEMIHSPLAITVTLVVALFVGAIAALQTRWGWSVLEGKQGSVP